MVLAATHVLSAPAEVVLALVSAPSAWPRWLPATLASDPRDGLGAADVLVRLDGPRPIRLRLAVRPLDDAPGGASWELVEGDLATSGSVRVAPHPDGAEVRWEVIVDLPITLPGVLLRELRSGLLPALSSALERVARAEAQPIGRPVDVLRSA